MAENDLKQALDHLKQANDFMKRLGECSGDWTAKIMLEEEFLNLQDACINFARCQAGIGAPKIKFKKPKK